MIVIDGSYGEGGGQIIRSSLCLSAITGEPVEITNVRAGRKKPGLLRQHLTALRAAREICDARVEGAELGSSRLKFCPGPTRNGNYRFQVGTAGSATLVAQTILPALMTADGNSTIEVEGGTHNPKAPCYDYLANVYLPLVQRMGPRFESSIADYGFYPAGGGKIKLAIEPVAELQPLTLLDRVGNCKPIVTSIVSSLPASVGQRECDTIRRKMNWPANCCQVREVPNPRGPGNVVLIEIQNQNVSEMFIGFGAVGVRAEQVARNVLKSARNYLAMDGVPVGRHLADQLMLPMGLAAHQGHVSQFKTMPLTQHSLTHKMILELFLNIKIETLPEESAVTVVVKPKDEPPNPAAS